VAASIPPLTYLTFDPVSRGVGASQVLPYVLGLARRGVTVELHSFETSPASSPSPAVAVRSRLDDAGVRWTAHEFGSGGGAGGVSRVARGALAIRGAPLVHARAHLAGASAVLGRPRGWVWDVRSLWTEERIEEGMLRRGGVSERVLRWAERRAACASDAVVTLSASAVPALSARTGCDVAAKAHVIPTCVDLSRFEVSPLPSVDVGLVRLLLSGTLNSLYDVPTMIRFAAARPDFVLERVGAGGSPWERALAAAGVEREELPFAEMPARLAQSHAGLCLQGLSSASAVAAAPIKAAEFLACGRPIVVSAGLGDLPALVTSARCGVVVDDTSDAGLDRAAAELVALLADPELASRCRAVAERHFNLEWAVDTLVDIYRSITTPT
jgi:glycosyltransferase involved in cell wall biosynthesis